MKTVLQALLVGLAIYFIWPSSDTKTATKTEYPEVAAAPKKSYRWKYRSWTDKMSDKRVMTATALSWDEPQFQFPYNGGSEVRFTIRKTGVNYEAMLEVDKGQFLSNTMGDERVRLRFDDGEA